MCPLTERALEIAATRLGNLISLDFNDFGYANPELTLQNSICGV